MTGFEKKLLKDLSLYAVPLCAAVVVLLSLVARVFMLPHVSRDMENFLLPWVDQFNAQPSIWAALSRAGTITNYPPLYNFFLILVGRLPFIHIYSIKVFSILFDYLMAFAVGLIVWQMRENSPYRKQWAVGAAALTCLLPIPMINSAMWGQCDSIFTFFLLLMLYMLLRERWTRAFLFFGLALCFKLQAIFLLPLLLLLYASRRQFSLLNFLVIPGTMVAASLPQAIASGNLLAAFDAYTRQVGGEGNAFVSYPNLSYLFEMFDRSADMDPGIAAQYSYLDQTQVTPMLTILALGMFAMAMAYIWLMEIRVERDNMVMLGAWGALTCVMLMPSMHERYGFSAELFLWVWFLLKPHWKRALPLAWFSYVGLASGLSFLTRVWLIDIRQTSVVGMGMYIWFTALVFKELWASRAAAGLAGAYAVPAPAAVGSVQDALAAPPPAQAEEIPAAATAASAGISSLWRRRRHAEKPDEEAAAERVEAEKAAVEKAAAEKAAAEKAAAERAAAEKAAAERAATERAAAEKAAAEKAAAERAAAEKAAAEKAAAEKAAAEKAAAERAAAEKAAAERAATERAAAEKAAAEKAAAEKAAAEKAAAERAAEESRAGMVPRAERKAIDVESVIASITNDRRQTAESDKAWADHLAAEAAIEQEEHEEEPARGSFFGFMRRKKKPREESAALPQTPEADVDEGREPLVQTQQQSQARPQPAAAMPAESGRGVAPALGGRGFSAGAAGTAGVRPRTEAPGPPPVTSIFAEKPVTAPSPPPPEVSAQRAARQGVFSAARREEGQPEAENAATAASRVPQQAPAPPAGAPGAAAPGALTSAAAASSSPGAQAPANPEQRPAAPATSGLLFQQQRPPAAAGVPPVRRPAPGPRAEAAAPTAAPAPKQPETAPSAAALPTAPPRPPASAVPAPQQPEAAGGPGQAAAEEPAYRSNFVYTVPPVEANEVQPAPQGQKTAAEPQAGTAQPAASSAVAPQAPAPAAVPPAQAPREEEKPQPRKPAGFATFSAFTVISDSTQGAAAPKPAGGNVRNPFAGASTSSFQAVERPAPKQKDEDDKQPD